jgi:hypothetical protein
MPMAVTLWQTPQSFSERKSRAPSRGVLMPDTVDLAPVPARRQHDLIDKGADGG